MCSRRDRKEQTVLLVLKEVQVLRENQVTATGPAGATGGGPPHGAPDQKVLKEYKVPVLNEITLTPQGAEGATGAQ